MKARLKDITKYTRAGSYQVSMSWDYLIEHLNRWTERVKGIAPLELNPEFQRGHVWTREQQIKYVEYMIKGGSGANIIYFNCAGWMIDWRGPFVLVDGLQRVTAAVQFLIAEIPAFGKLITDYKDPEFMRSVEFLLNVNNLENMSEVLSWYLEMNSGGVVHTEEELDRVRGLLKKEEDCYAE